MAVQSLGHEAVVGDAAVNLQGGSIAVSNAMTPLPDSETVEVTPSIAATNSDRPAGRDLRFESVFAEHAPYVLRVLPRLGVGAADVDDVAQEVFLAVHHGLPQFEGRSRVRTWIYGICLRLAGNYRRRAHRRREVRGLELDAPVEASQGERLEQTRSRNMLNAALDLLTERKREVFVLYEIEELSMNEVAQAVGCPLFTAYARLYAARREMKQAIEQMSQPGGRP